MNMKSPDIFLKVLIFCLLAQTLPAQTVQLTLEGAIEQARQQSIAARQAGTLRETRYWAWRTFQSNYKPQLLFSGRLPAFTRAVQEVQQPNGTIDFQPVRYNNSSAGLYLSQSITATGGTVYVATELQRFDDFDRSVTLYNGSPLSVGLEQPLFRFNALRWDKQVEPLKYEESRRQYTQDMEQIAYNTTSYFFDLLLAQANFDIASANLVSNDTIYKIAQERYELGKLSRNDLLQLELEQLKSRKALAAARQEAEGATLQLRNYLGQRDTGLLQLAIPVVANPLKVDPGRALQEAGNNRSEAIAFLRRTKEADREIARAKGETGFNAMLSASVGFSNRSAQLGDLYNKPQDQELIQIELSVPIMDWGRARSRVETALANQQLVAYTIEQERNNFDQEIYTQVTLLHMLGDQLTLTADADRIAAERYQIAKDRYFLGNISITDLSIALQEKDQARQDYVRSLREYWRAFFRLRALTLYDFEKLQKINY